MANENAPITRGVRIAYNKYSMKQVMEDKPTVSLQEFANNMATTKKTKKKKPTGPCFIGTAGSTCK